MRALLSVAGALLLSYGCANDDDGDDDVPARTQTGNPATADDGGANGSVAECVETCVSDAADCAAACTGGGDCAAVCDSTFASCELECEQIGE